MNDTPEHIKKRFREMIMNRSNEERFMMGISMYDMAREITISSFPPKLSGKEFRELLFLRMYGNDFDEITKKNIIEHLKKLD